MRRILVSVMSLVITLLPAAVVAQDESDAVERFLLGEVRSVLGGHPPPYPNVSTTWSADPPILDEAVLAGVDASGLAHQDAIVQTTVARDAQDRPLLAIHGFSTTATAEVDEPMMLDGILAWQAADWDRRFDAAPENEAMMLGDKSVWRTTFDVDPGGTYHYHVHAYRPVLDTDAIASGRVYVDPWDVLDLGADAVQYLYVVGDSAIAVTAIDDVTATWFFDQLP